MPTTLPQPRCVVRGSPPVPEATGIACRDAARKRASTFLFSLFLLVGAIPTLVADAVILREIMYHPPANKPAWVEIENLTATPFDMAGWELRAGAMHYAFPQFSAGNPSQTILRPHEILVIASTSEAGFRTNHALPDQVRLLGPWSGHLKHSSDRITLKDKNGLILSQVRFQDSGNWPISADGAGHTLVLKNPHDPTDNWRNWRASELPLGTPGRVEPVLEPTQALESKARIGELHFANDHSVDWIEIWNTDSRVLPGGTLSVSAKRDLSDAVQVPMEIQPGQRIVLPTQFRSSGETSGKRIYLSGQSGRILDAGEFKVLAASESWQRDSEEGSEWFRSANPSPGVANQPIRNRQIIINEILYDPPQNSNCPEFIELFNRGTASVDLGGWRISEAVEFEFPAGTKLNPASFAVVTANAAALLKIHGLTNVLGEFKGRLSNKGERIRLLDGLGNLADQVDYRSGGHWPTLASGGGSSLERVHPSLDGTLASAWGASEESGKTSFQKYNHTGTYAELEPLGAIHDFRELHLLMADEGHVAIRNIRFKNIRTGEEYLPANARESRDGTGKTGWLIQGNHGGSHWEGDVLHLISGGHGDNRANRIEIDVPGIKPGTTCELSFEARWISGSPRLIAQTWDHSFSWSLLLPIPAGLGTPGRANSRLALGPPPQLDFLSHAPVVPRPGQPIRISAKVTSVNPPLRVGLFHRRDSSSGNAAWQYSAMTPDLAQAKVANGVSVEYSTLLAGYSNQGEVVQFYVIAEGADGAIQQLPRNGSNRPALFVVDGRSIPLGPRTERFIISERDLLSISHGGEARYGYRYPKLSNHYLNGTLISEEREVWHNIEIRRSGSAWNRSDTLTRAKWKAQEDQPFRGRHKWTFDDDAAGERRYSDRIARYLLYLLDHPSNENEFVRVIVNAGPERLRDEVEPVDSQFIHRRFPGQESGNLYRIDDEWWFTDAWKFRSRDASWLFKGTLEAGRYRSEWMKRTHETADDYSGLVRFFQKVSSPDYTEEEISGLIDADAMLKLAAVSGYIANWDTFTMARGKNGYFYQRSSDGKFQMLHWDSDAGFERDPKAEPFHGQQEPFGRWIEKPYNMRIFTHHLGTIVNHLTEGSARMRAWLEAQNAANPSTVCDIPRFEKWFRDRNEFARKTFGSALNE